MSKIHIHKHICGGSLKKSAPSGREIQKTARKELGISDVCKDSRHNRAARAKAIRNGPHQISIQSSRKHKEDGDSPDKLHTLLPMLR
ncbi:hypothetical protein PANDA_020056, partial [Ailuropoda melanoleuca]